jgi:hypothetical protein
LPLAPEFQAVENAQPFVVRADPPIGSDVQTEEMVFVVTARDPDRKDTLYARWLIDYPRFEAPVSRKAREDISPAPADPSVPNERTLRFLPECGPHAISNTTTQHRLLLVISDRPFIEEDDQRLPNFLDSTPSYAGVIRIAWFFRKTCR